MVLFFSVEERGIGRIGRGVSERVKAFNRDRDPAPTVFVKFVLKGWHSAAA